MSMWSYKKYSLLREGFNKKNAKVRIFSVPGGDGGVRRFPNDKKYKF